MDRIEPDWAFIPEWCERCGLEGHNGLHCEAEEYEPSPYDGTYSED